MLLIIVITHEHLTAYKTFFIIVADFKCSFIILINIISLKITMMLKKFFINIKFTALNFA